MIKYILIFLLPSLFAFQLLNAQGLTNIPDNNFEQALIDLGIDSDGTVNGEVLTDDINTITDLNLLNYNIEDLRGIENFDSLKTLNCSNNRLNSIDLSNNVKLINLDCSANLLDSLNLSSNTSLENLYCQNNLITVFNVSANTLLKKLDFSSNRVSSISIIENDSLTSLKCANNRLTNLNVSSNTKLTELMCSSNQLTALVVNNNVLLTTLFCASNKFTDLNLSENDSLVFLDCSDNQLTSLDVSTNKILQHLTCSANQLTELVISENDSLTLLSCSINRLTSLDVSENMKLEGLICASNQFTRLDVRANFTLRTLDFSFNLIGSADLSENDSLNYFDCSNNQLKYLNAQNGNNSELGFFNALNNPALTCIVIDDESQIGDTWLKDSTATYSVNCEPIQTYIEDNNFEQALIDLGLDTGILDSLVVTDSINTLAVLDISGKGITDLSGIQDFLGLQSFDCSNNQLSSLDLIKNKSLTSVNCSANDLTILIIKNNNNANLIDFDSRNNPLLTCIAVDDETQIGAFWLRDAGASFSNNCHPGQTFVPDDNFEQALVDLQLDAVLDNYVMTDSIDSIKVLRIDSLYISDLTGIEDFIALDTLDCSSNNLSALDISKNAALKSLTCFNNYLTDLVVSNNDSLISLNIGHNQLNSLIITQNAMLEELIFDSNYLTAIDISGNPDLVSLNCNSNKMTHLGLDLTTAPNLEELYCANNQFTTLNISQNDQLIKLDCSNNYIEILNLASNDSLRRLDCSLNKLASLDLSNNAKLDTIFSNSNQLTNLTFVSNPLLRMISCDYNLVDSIDVTSNDSLRTLLISFNHLKSLDVSNNGDLNILHCDDNRLDELDVTKNLALLELSCAYNQLNYLNTFFNGVLLGLDCNGNQLTSLDVSSNVVLQELSIADNQIGTINTSFNTVLTSLICYENKLIALDLDNNGLIANLSCAGNEITSLDLSANTNLVALNSSSNKLISLIISNGNNDSLSTFNSVNNPDLTCIEVDDLANIGSSWQKDETASYSENCHYTDTYVPDDNFESALAANTGVPDDNDNYIPTSSIENLVSLDVNNKNISDLTGIWDFASLQTLNIGNNNIDSINLNNNSALVNLDCSGNQLDALNLSANTALKVIDVSSNNVTVLDFHTLTFLEEITCDFNDLTYLDLNDNSSLTSLSCASNKLRSLTVQNSNNASLITFDATGNPDLTCIEIDDPANIGGSWLKDESASYSEDCHYNETYVPDNAFEQALIDLGYDYSSVGPLDDYVPTPRINLITALNIRNLDVTDLTGIQDFVNLVSLNCSNNRLTDLDISNNSKLEFLNCSGNQLTNLDVSANSSLYNLDISDNLLTNIAIDQNQALTNLNCSSNQITSLNITQNINLEEVYAQINLLFSVDANSGHNQNLITFDLRNNPNLTCILIDDIAAAEAHATWFKDIEAHYKLECNDDDNDGVVDENDSCPTTPFGDPVDLFGCSFFYLPVDNFSVLTTGETCRNGNNGKINITAIETYIYQATLIGNGVNNAYNFTNTVEIRNVRSGTYELCITVENRHDYKQCYSVAITEPENLVVQRRANPPGGRVAYEMSGGTSYKIDFNGLLFETTDNYITLMLEKGKNTVKITAEAECQGVFEEIIFFSDQILLFPNPFENYLHVNLGDHQTEKIEINIYATSGILVSSKIYQVQIGDIYIDTSSLVSGLYTIHLRREDDQRTFKMLKR